MLLRTIYDSVKSAILTSQQDFRVHVLLLLFIMIPGYAIGDVHRMLVPFLET